MAAADLPVVAACWASSCPGLPVVAFTTQRLGAGGSVPPFDHLNLGNRSAAGGDDPAQVERNRDELQQRGGLPSAPHWLRQVHGTCVLRFDQPPIARGIEIEPEADAAVTSVPGVVLAILTADCLPVVFAARDGGEVAAAHAGWRGLADGMLEATVAAMHTHAADLLVWLGPAAGPQHYEIGANVRDAFMAHDAGATSAFTATRPGHWRVDLYALARQRLQAVGIAPEAISGGEHCTIAQPQQFFSHRRDGQSGRIATLAWISAHGG